MNQKKVDLNFDCLEFKQQVQDKIADSEALASTRASEIKNLLPEKQIEYFNQKANSSSLGSWWKSVKNQ